MLLSKSPVASAISVFEICAAIIHFAALLTKAPMPGKII
jgi:hypothetical protein